MVFLGARECCFCMAPHPYCKPCALHRDHQGYSSIVSVCGCRSLCRARIPECHGGLGKFSLIVSSLPIPAPDLGSSSGFVTLLLRLLLRHSVALHGRLCYLPVLRRRLPSWHASGFESSRVKVSTRARPGAGTRRTST